MRFAGLVPLVLLAIAAAGCARHPVDPVSMHDLREYREAKLAERTRARLVATVKAPEVLSDTSLQVEDAVRQAFRERGERLGVLVGLELVEHYPLDPLGLWVYVYQAGSSRALERGYRLLQGHPDIDNVQRDSLYRTQTAQAREPDEFTDKDPLSPLQTFPADQLERLHEFATGRGVVIAIIDTGIDTAHEDLVGAELSARDLVDQDSAVPPEMHATAVAGVILAQPDNGVGLIGIAPGARVLVLRACWQEPVSETAFCNTFTLAKALAAAMESGADVVNLSLTGPLDPLLSRLVANLVDRNMIVVAAHRDENDQGQFPGALPGVIAATSRPTLAENPGPLFAPGEGVLTLLPGDRYGLRDGSSISAAQVSGVVSLFLEREPSLTAEDLESILRGEGVEQEGLSGLLEALASMPLD